MMQQVQAVAECTNRRIINKMLIMVNKRKFATSRLDGIYIDGKCRIIPIHHDDMDLGFEIAPFNEGEYTVEPILEDYDDER